MEMTMKIRRMVILMFKVRIRGVDRVIRNLVRANDDVYESARNGCNAAAEHLLNKIRSKFGVYNSTGGDPGGAGAWKKLTLGTRLKKVQKYGTDRGPLIASGKTVNSLSIKEGGKGTLAASVTVDSDYMIHHVYGAPGANVPMRDPMRVTAKEERDKCHDIIEDYINSAIRRSGL